MNEEWTCGKGLAQNASMPAMLADLLAAMADTLDAHRPALDLANSAGQAEDTAYAMLVREFRDISGRLKATAERMAGYHDLAAASHDEQAMADPARMAPYRRFVEIERELVALFEAAASEGEAMLQGEPPAG